MPPGSIATVYGINRTRPNPSPVAQSGRPGAQQRRCRRPSYCPAQPAQHETGPPDRARRGGQRPRLLSTGHDLMTSRPPQRSAFLTGQLATFRWTCPPNSPGAATRCLSPRHILPLDYPHQPESAHLSRTTRVLTDLAICRKPRGLPPSKRITPRYHRVVMAAAVVLTFASGPGGKPRGPSGHPWSRGWGSRGAGVTEVLAGGPRFPWLSLAHHQRPHPAAVRHPAARPAGLCRRVARPPETWLPSSARARVRRAPLVRAVARGVRR
jgi:hypothetical protein